MGAPIRKTFTLMLGGTSLTAGRLTNPPLPWTYFLAEDMRASPECQGPVRIINTGMGSQPSNFGAAQAILKAPLRPTHVLMEDFGINDCAIGPLSLAQATANFNSMVASYRAANPDVIIVHQTMSPASATDTSRTNLPAYYDNGLANAALNGLISLDNYYGTALVPGGWPKPLNPLITVGAQAFQITPTTGYVGMDSGVTWNPADKAATIDLSNGDLTALSSSATSGSLRATTAISGLIHTEYTCAVNLTYPRIGLANSVMTTSTVIGTGGNNSVGLQPNGNVELDGVVLGNAGFTVSDGNTIAMEVDTASKLVYFMKGAIRSAGYSYAAVAGSVYPAMTVNAVGTGSTARFTDAGDGLHPLWTNGFQLYSYPNILAWARQAMADFW